MEGIELWFFVDETGTECASNTKPRRIINYINEHILEDVSEWSRFTKPRSYFLDLHEKGMLSEWYTHVWSQDGGMYNGTDLDCEYTELPKGFIKQVMGVDLTVKDEPLRYQPRNY